MKGMSVVEWVVMVLVVVGGINWGLVGAFDFNLVAMIFKSMPVVARVVYVLVGLAAVYMAFDVVRHGKE